jgi:hypothetical protein
MVPLIAPAIGPARMAQRYMGSWKKWIDVVNVPIGMGMVSGGVDMTIASAAMRAVNVMVFVFVIGCARFFVLRFVVCVTFCLYVFLLFSVV